jgi:hypothetical protein
MKLVGLMPVRNEDWVLGLSLRVALLWCDSVVVLLHECVDGSQGIVEQVIRENDKGRIIVTRATGEWTEMQHRQQMLEHARAAGATHIAITDADEVLSGNLIPGPICGVPLEYAIKEGAMLQLPLYYMRGSVTRYHSNGIWGNRWTDVAFRDNPAAHWGGDNFHARAPRGAAWQPYRPIEQGQGGIMHLWACTGRRIRAKCALYKVTERLRWPHKSLSDIDRMYSWAIHGDSSIVRYGTPDTWTYTEAPESWWAPYAHLMKYLDVDAEPWQEAEVQRLVAKHGAAMFAGLDLFGVA